MGITVKSIHGKLKVIKDNLVISEDGTWLAVMVNLSWRLVDVDVAIATLKDKQITHKAMQNKRKEDRTLDIPYYKYVEFFFLSDPEQFVFSHCSEADEWQLLARPVTYEEFKVMAHVTEAFFTMVFPSSLFLLL